MENKLNANYSIECDILTEDDQVICSQFLISNGINNIFLKKENVELMSDKFYKQWRDVKFCSKEKAIAYIEEIQKELDCTIDANLLFNKKAKKVKILCIKFYIDPSADMGVSREIVLERIFFNTFPNIIEEAQRRARLRKYYSIFYWAGRLKWKVLGWIK